MMPMGGQMVEVYANVCKCMQMYANDVMPNLVDAKFIL